VNAKIVEEPSYRDRTHVFRDRLQAAELLAQKLSAYADVRALLLAIPSGGVPIGYIIAKELDVAFDIAVVRKIQIPWNTEAGFGAVTWEGDVVLNDRLVEGLKLSSEVMGQCVSRAQEVVQARIKKFRGDRPFPNVKGRTVVVVDDGLASGFTMLAAVRSIRRRSPKGITVAVPTASNTAVELLIDEVDELICPNIRGGPMFAVADAYMEWHDLSDKEVMGFLSKA